MKRIEKLDQARKEKANLKEWGINSAFYWAYQIWLITKNETIDFDDAIWDQDVEKIIDHCKEYDIKKITVSSGFSGVIQTLGLFEDKGCKIIGLKKIKSQYKDFYTQEHETINAIEIEIH